MNRNLATFIRIFKPKSVKKNSILLHAGDICKEFYFLYSGSVRTYFIDKNGYEKTRYVILDNQIGTQGNARRDGHLHKNPNPYDSILVIAKFINKKC